MTKIFSAFLLTLLGLSGCEFITHQQHPDAIYTLQGTTDQQDINILVQRLQDYRPNLLANIEYLPKYRSIVFRHMIPDPELLQFFAATPGKLSMREENQHHSWITNQHIKTTNSSSEHGNLILDIMMTDEGAEIMRLQSQNNLGKNIVLIIDQQVVYTAVLREPLNDGISLYRLTNNAQQLRRMSTLLRYGNLSKPISLKRNDSLEIN
jgi:hypothetical protein